MALTASRSDVDFYRIDLSGSTTEEQQASARLYVADMAGRKGWSVEETRDLLEELGLLEEREQDA